MLRMEPSFDRFVPTEGARRALALTRAIAVGHVAAPRILLLSGPAGVGKTHLLRAVLNCVKRQRPEERIVHTTAERVIEGLVEAVKGGQTEADALGWDGASLIAIDDLHVLARRPLTEGEVARRLGRAVAAGSRVICACGPVLSALGPLVAGLRREAGFALALLGPATVHEMRRIIVEAAGREGARPGKHVLAALAASSRGDVRRAIGALNGSRLGRELRGNPGNRRILSNRTGSSQP